MSNLSKLSVIIGIIVSIIGNDKRNKVLYVLKIKTGIKTYIKIGITNDVSERIPNIYKTFEPMGVIIPLFVMKLKNNDAEYYESIFKKTNIDFLCNDVYVNSKSLSTESYPYNDEFIDRFLRFFSENKIYDEIEKCYYDNDDSLVKLIKQNSNSKSLNFFHNSPINIFTNMMKIFKTRYMKDILKCPDELTVKELEGKSCAVFFDDDIEKMYGWYEGKILLFNQRKTQSNNCTIEYIYNNEICTTDLIIKKKNYGPNQCEDQCWVLLDKDNFIKKFFRKNKYFLIFNIIMTLLLYNIIIYIMPFLEDINI